MGAWGTGLYQNDAGSDAKSVFADLSRRPLDTDALVAQVLETLDCGDQPARDEDADIWLALADLLHQYGLEHPVLDRARRLIMDGEDLAHKRNLGMSERDLTKRAKVLADTLERWSEPHPKPKKRKAPKAAEPFLPDIGDVWVFPTMNNAARPFHVKDVDLSLFAPDGWGAFAVADRFHALGFRACYLFALLSLSSKARPTLDEVTKAAVQECTSRLAVVDETRVYPMVFEGRLAKRKQGLKQWNAEWIGTLDIDADKVRASIPERFKQQYNAQDPDGLLWIEDTLTASSLHHAASRARTGDSVSIAAHATLRLSDFCR